MVKTCENKTFAHETLGLGSPEFWFWGGLLAGWKLGVILGWDLHHAKPTVLLDLFFI